MNQSRFGGLTHALLDLETWEDILGHKVEMAIEIKRATAPTLSRGFHSARDAVKARDAYVVHGGDETWPMTGDVTAISLIALMTKLVEK